MIARMGKKRVIICAVLILVACVALTVIAIGLNLPEASGKTVKKDGKLTIDCSHMDQGYIMVKGKKSSKRLKVQISTAGAKLNYDLNGEGNYEVFPLQFGSGKYQKMPDELSCFLYPNQYVSYDENTACVQHATEMCKGMSDQKDIYKAVCNYVTSNFVYDFIKSVTVKPGQLPQIDECWTSKMGICQDLSAMTCAMLRSQGIPARLMIGTVGANTYHAWVVAVVNGEEKFFDPTAELNASSKTDTYTTERYY